MKPKITSPAVINYLDYAKNKLNYEDLAIKIMENLESVGYVVVQNFNVDVANLESSAKQFVEISKLVGNPIGHDANGKIVWDIKSNDKSISNIKTYSEHSHEAQLHTDSQYSFYPEDYFGLLSLVKADCSGGISSLLSLKNILKELENHPDGKQIRKILSTTNYPFIIPNVFKKSESENPEFNFGPILRENEIRFRVDTFEKALKFPEAICSSEQLEAYKELKKIVLNSSSIQQFYLEPCDLIFVNNKTMLHGRSEFKDAKRHLLRIRMNKFSAPINQN